MGLRQLAQLSFILPKNDEVFQRQALQAFQRPEHRDFQLRSFQPPPNVASTIFNTLEG